MLRGRSRALFRLFLLPLALDRPCDLLVLFGHLREAVLPQALRPMAQLSSAIREMVWHSAWDIERRGGSQPAELRTNWIAARPARHFGSLTYTGQGYEVARAIERQRQQAQTK